MTLLFKCEIQLNFRNLDCILVKKNAYLVRVESILKMEQLPNFSKLLTMHAVASNAQMSSVSFQVTGLKYLRFRSKQAPYSVFRYMQNFLSQVLHRFPVQDRCSRLPTARLETCQDTKRTLYFRTYALCYHRWIKQEPKDCNHLFDALENLANVAI